MSHPDPLFDPENAYEDDDMLIEDEYEYRDEDRDHIDRECLMDNANYDDYNDFYGNEEETTDESWVDDYDDSMDGDHESGLASCGWGTDEDYGYYGDDREDFHADDAIGYVDYYEDGPYDD